MVLEAVPALAMALATSLLLVSLLRLLQTVVRILGHLLEGTGPIGGSSRDRSSLMALVQSEDLRTNSSA